ncbi:MAG: hypothetical protein ACRC92_27520 [Peptostreptococcaceae bacterium]
MKDNDHLDRKNLRSREMFSHLSRNGLTRGTGILDAEFIIGFDVNEIEENIIFKNKNLTDELTKDLTIWNFEERLGNANCIIIIDSVILKNF